MTLNWLLSNTLTRVEWEIVNGTLTKMASGILKLFRTNKLPHNKDAVFPLGLFSSLNLLLILGRFPQQYLFF